jgi:5-carboxymethyl-2-hydroxymuconate isomerase
MPHLKLEYTSNLDNLDVNRCLLELNKVLIDSGEFEELDIKSRAARFDHYLVGGSPEQRAYAHLTLSMLSGRTVETKRALSNKLLECLQQICPSDPAVHLQFTVEILDIDRESYAKRVIVS